MFHTDEQNNVADVTSSNSTSKPSKKQSLMKCSLCGKSFDRCESKSMPFCSPRCRQIDLGHWLNESYGLPVESGDGVPGDFEE